jgi:hypothetical protein
MLTIQPVKKKRQEENIRLFAELSLFANSKRADLITYLKVTLEKAPALPR